MALGNQRRVQHLRLRCEGAVQADQVTRVADRIGEALRCASLPGAPGRMLLVRRLALGRLPAPGNPVALTLQLQAAVQRAGWRWVRGDTAAAAAAPAVWFAHLAHAVATAWAWRSAGRALDAWYWPLALPGVALGAQAPALRQGLCGLIEREVGVGAAAAWWPQPATPAQPPTGVLHSVAPEAHGPRPHASPVSTANAAPAWAATDDAAPQAPTRLFMNAEGSVRAAAAPPPVAARGASRAPAAPAAGDTVHFRPTFTMAVAREAQGTNPTPGGWLRPDADTPTFQALPALGGGPALQRPPAGDVSTSFETTAGIAPPALPPALAELVDPSRHAWATPVPTAVGGLLLLLPALQRMPWLDFPRDAADFAALSHLAIARLRPPADDPVHGLIAHLAGDAGLAPRLWLARDVWRTLRTWLRNEAGIGPAHLLARRAALRWDATHIDLHFALNDADLRIRRAGLDQSPGWLPALGRVVTVHFVATGSDR